MNVTHEEVLLTLVYKDRVIHALTAERDALKIDLANAKAEAENAHTAVKAIKDKYEVIDEEAALAEANGDGS